MNLIANGLNGNYLSNFLPGPNDDVDYVMAAIAYGSNFPDKESDLIGHCVKNRYRLDIWMRYDETVPVAPSMLRRILNHHKDNIFCSLVPDCLHSKVIWWKGYGAYIGSANLTDRAWVSNIECGIFLSESDLQKDNMQIELESFFDRLRSEDACFPLTEEIIKELEKIDAEIRKSRINTGGSRSVPVWDGPVFFDKNKSKDKAKEIFRKEWQETLTHLRSIGTQLRENRPSWISAETPIEWEIDQFLHAYYYNKVGDARRKPYEDYFIRNKANPNLALNVALDWWKGLSTAPTFEDLSLYTYAPHIQKSLAKENVLSLSLENFAKVCEYTHATKDHLVKMELSVFGISDVKHLSREERIPIYAEWLMKQRNKKGMNILELINFVLYGGKNEELWARLYQAYRDPELYIPHYGLNSMAEVTGWARPNISPPRNGRTSKALRALGYDVKIY